MTKSTPKFSDTSIRVLETLKILVISDSSIQDIINYFEKKDSQNKTFTNEAILKYINTLKVFGFKINKVKDKYVLLNVPTQIDFSEEDLEAIRLLEDFAKSLPEKNINMEMNIFLQNLERFFTPKTRKLATKLSFPDISFEKNYKQYEKKVVQYEKYCAEKLKLKIEYWHVPGTKASAIVEPKCIDYKDNRVYLKVYNPVSAQNQDINIDDVLSLEQLPIKVNPTNILSSVTFLLKDRLAKSYKLHEGERLVKQESNGNCLIMNQSEDKILLLRRLMRYGSYCEVISPKKFREDMKQKITRTINNYK